MQETATPTLLRQPTVCRMLDLSRNGLTKLRTKDPTFPKPIKFGQTKQAVVFYDAEELAAWIEAKKAGRAA